MSHLTRFRAYQLHDCGASFSLSVNEEFTLIEARYDQINRSNILWELCNVCKQDRISTLHITSWDDDHCNASELKQILSELKPLKIEYPSYLPHTQNAKESLDLILNYTEGNTQSVTPPIVISSDRIPLIGSDEFYNPEIISTNSSNNNSIVKFFRVGSFTVLSLGDCESASIRDRLMQDDILTTEVDVLILAHHGSDNGFTTIDFLKAIKPKVAICASNYANQYGHPDKEILNRLSNAEIDYYSTKTGDVLVKTIDKYSFDVCNFGANNTSLNSIQSYSNKTWYIND